MKKDYLAFIKAGTFLINEEIPTFERLSKVLNSLYIPYDSFNGKIGVPKQIKLSVLKHWDFEKVYRLVHFLKDFGLEYIDVVSINKAYVAGEIKHGEMSKSPVYFLGDYNFQEFKDPYGKSADMHISEFLTFSPRTHMDFFAEKKFPETIQRYYYTKPISENQELQNSWEEDFKEIQRNMIDIAYEGDASNMWNND